MGKHQRLFINDFSLLTIWCSLLLRRTFTEILNERHKLKSNLTILKLEPQ